MRNLHEFIEGVQSSHKISPESRDRLDEIQFHSAYAEPGYDDPESGIIATGNWNNADKKAPPPKYWVKADDFVERVAHVLEKRFKAELEWSDEWDTCSECQKLVRTQADSYGWTRAYFELEGDRLCCECVKEHAEEVLQSLEGNFKSAVTDALGLDPADHGYIQVLKDLEHGLHEHMAADPTVIAKGLRELGVTRFLFKIDDASQFYFTFSCWVHESEVGKCGVEPDIATDAAVSPAEMMKRALQSAAMKTPEVERGSLLSTVKLTYHKTSSNNKGKGGFTLACKTEAERVQKQLIKDGYEIRSCETDIDKDEFRIFGAIKGSFTYSQLKGDGNAEVRLVEPQEFINGIK